MEKVQFILQFLHSYTFIPTCMVIREMRVCMLSLDKGDTVYCFIYKAWVQEITPENYRELNARPALCSFRE